MLRFESALLDSDEERGREKCWVWRRELENE